ncbi:MAG TPA: 2-phospho-L-lactate transferase [Acidimicrobiales bacterium]|nr:2-phospho-L-lactate transferase [Acidimicrobiales bacterium]
MITVLSGGVGAARLLRALSEVVDPSELCAVVNVGDDLVLHGLTICPDLDTITYTLAGLNNDELGWGLRGETWRVMDELGALGGEDWFRLGDRDLATHLYRSQRLAQGATKTEVTRELTQRLGVGVTLLPVTDDPIATEFVTEHARLSFQEYFVKYHHDVVVRGVEVVGATDALMTSDVARALRDARRIVIAPSNPVISIDPILRVPGVREILASRRDDIVAVSPLVGGAALKGPADRLMRELGHESSALGVADYYGELVGTWVIDDVDAALADPIRHLGMHVEVTTTIMAEPQNARRLATVLVS